MTPQELKNSILQLAIQGKLVEQRPAEGTAAELFKQIQAEKQSLIKAGKLKKEKPLPPITDDEKPFEIPESWMWVRLGDHLIIERGGSPRPIQEYLTTDPTGINWIKIGDTDKGGKYINQTKEKIKPEGLKKSRMVHKGDFLLSNSMSFGRPYILNINGAIHDGWLVLRPIINFFDKDYLYHLLSSPMVFSQFSNRVAGAVVNNLNSDKVALTVVPLPPLAEQKRIVAKIEELLPLIDRYGAAWSRLEDFNKRFPNDMQKSILQMAIQGKLVEQRPEEGTAEDLYKQIQSEKQSLIKAGKLKKEKPLPPITDDEKPFDIPDSWKWCYVGEIFDHNTGKAMNSSAKASNKKGAVRKFITTSNLYWNSFDFSSVKEMFFSDDELERCTATKNDILMCEGGAYYGRTAIWNFDYDICFQNHIHRLRPYSKISEQFFYYIFFLYRNIGLMSSKGTAMPGLSSITLHNLIIPLPPLAEQKRIVAKIEELLPLCERLKEE
ncbi:MAG: restriction endonuclease subunit S [Victivallales bacterium]|nr:restriction endonuclease subunit S [Victivallales bacterium]